MENEMIRKPVIDWIKNECGDPRDAYSVRINGHVVRVTGVEESARNYAWALEAYIMDTRGISGNE